MHSGEDVGEASLSSPPKNVGEDTLPSSLAVPASSPILDAGVLLTQPLLLMSKWKKVRLKLWLCKRLLGHLLKDLLLKLLEELLEILVLLSMLPLLRKL